MDGEKRVVEKLLSRRKLKRSYEYEVEWVGLHSDKNSWLSRDKCEPCPPGFTSLTKLLRIARSVLASQSMLFQHGHDLLWLLMLGFNAPSELPRIVLRRLVELGFEKMVNAIDIKEAAAQGLYQRPLTTAVIEKHLADLGIEPEFGTHSRIRGLSGVLSPALLSLHFVVLCT